MINDFDEDRIDNIGQNAALGLHYPPVRKPALLSQCPFCGKKFYPSLGREGFSQHLRRSNTHKNIGDKKRQRILDSYFARVTSKIVPNYPTYEEHMLTQLTGIQ